MNSLVTNIAAMNAQRTYKINYDNQKKSIEKLSSGYRVNRAADDAAGLSISERMRWQIRGLYKASQNCEDGFSFLQVGDGAMDEVDAMLHRMKELAVQAANDTNTSVDRSQIQLEIDQIVSEISRINTDTDFNTMRVFGQERSVTIEEVNPTTQATQVVSKDSFFQEGNRYGLAEVLGENNVYSDDRLTDRVVIDSTFDVTKGSYSTSVLNKEHIASWLDFSGLGKDFIVSDLYGHGFNSSCGTCSRKFSIQFVGDGGDSTSPEGVKYSFLGEKTFYPKLEINISDCASGADVVKHILSAVEAAGPGTSDRESWNHYTQYGVKQSEPSKLYIFDERSVRGAEDYDTSFELTAREINGDIIAVDPTTIHPTNPAQVITIENRDLWIQSGALDQSGFFIERSVVDPRILGIKPLGVTDYERASFAIDAIDKAVDILSEQRAKAGAQMNRLEYAWKIDDNVSENTQASESRIRDTDMAKEMVTQSMQSILAQAGQSMMAQANQSTAGVLKLLS